MTKNYLDTSNKLTLLVCSNRKKINFETIWCRIIKKELSKIILVTQGNANSFVNKNRKVQHLKLDNYGRSRALNIGLLQAKTKFIGLTDDDCLLHNKWLTASLKQLIFSKADLIFGKTLPYNQKKHKYEVCPSTFSKLNKTLITKVCEHWIHVGFDNNVVIKKEVFDNIGGYKSWLGPGTIAEAAEDAEFIIRSLIAGYKIAYSPKMIVYHNKWLNKVEWNELSRSYVLGGITAYGFYAFQGVKECKPILLEHLYQGISFIKEDVKEMIIDPIKNISFLKKLVSDIFLILKGLVIALTYTVFIPIPDKENVVKRFYK